MDLKSAKMLIEKISGLYKGIYYSRGRVSNVERDLMLSYIRDLYDIFYDADASAVSPKDQSNQEIATPPSKEPDFEVVERQAEPTYRPARIIEIPDSIKELEKEQKTISEKPVAPIIATTPAPPLAPKEVPKVERTSFDTADLTPLFEYKKATEISEKLSERPITDLTKALAINDRLLYMNELFGRDIDALNESLKLLNKFDNIEEAKSLITTLAQQYKWLDEEKLDTARDFIKLVRRKYI